MPLLLWLLIIGLLAGHLIPPLWYYSVIGNGREVEDWEQVGTTASIMWASRFFAQLVAAEAGFQQQYHLMRSWMASDLIGLKFHDPLVAMEMASWLPIACRGKML